MSEPITCGLGNSSPWRPRIDRVIWGTMILTRHDLPTEDAPWTSLKTQPHS